MNIFDDIASRYDTPDRIKESNIISEEIKKHLLNTTDNTAIDFGCGTGAVGLQLSGYFKEMLFIDSSKANPSSFSKAFKNFLADNGLRHIRFHDLRHTNADSAEKIV